MRGRGTHKQYSTVVLKHFKLEYCYNGKLLMVVTHACSMAVTHGGSMVTTHGCRMLVTHGCSMSAI